MVQSRYFTVNEANALVPMLQQRFGRILQMRSQLRTRIVVAAGERLQRDLVPQPPRRIDRGMPRIDHRQLRRRRG